MSYANYYYTAIIFFAPAAEKQPLKYRNIKNRSSLERFITSKHADAWYINYYNKATKAFVERVYLLNT
jgi:hypothetical protein